MRAVLSDCVLHLQPNKGAQTHRPPCAVILCAALQGCRGDGGVEGRGSTPRQGALSRGRGRGRDQTRECCAGFLRSVSWTDVRRRGVFGSRVGRASCVFRRRHASLRPCHAVFLVRIVPALLLGESGRAYCKTRFGYCQPPVPRSKVGLAFASRIYV